MIGDQLGQSFSPLSWGQQGPGQNGQGNGAQPAGSTPVGDAIQTLALRIPRFVGSRSMAPGQLLNAPGMAGAPQDIQALLRQLLGQMSVAPPSAGGGNVPPMLTGFNPMSSPQARLGAPQGGSQAPSQGMNAMPGMSGGTGSGGGMASPMSGNFGQPSIIPGDLPWYPGTPPPPPPVAGNPGSPFPFPPPLPPDPGANFPPLQPAAPQGTPTWGADPGSGPGFFDPNQGWTQFPGNGFGWP